MQKSAYRVAAVIMSVFETITMGICTARLYIVYGKDVIRLYNAISILKKADELLGEESPESLHNLIERCCNNKNNHLPKNDIEISKQDILAIRYGLAKRNISPEKLVVMAGAQ